MRTIAIIGSRSRLGKAFAISLQGHARILTFDRPQFDLADSAEVYRRLTQEPVDVILNCAALTQVDYCETHEAEANQLNGYAAESVAKAAQSIGAQLIHFSTDFVFSGEQATPYAEDDEPNPISVYGSSKLLGERLIQQACENHAIFRISWLFGAQKPAFPEWVIEQAKTRTEPLPIVGDKWGCVTRAEEIVEALHPVIMGEIDCQGIYHLCNPGTLSWADYGRCVIDAAASAGVQLSTKLVQDIKLSDMSFFEAKRPAHSSLNVNKFSNETGIHLSSGKDAINQHLVKY